jgi:hypothetical protein
VFFKIIVGSPVTGLEWARGFQNVKVPRLRDNSTGESKEVSSVVKSL